MPKHVALYFCPLSLLLALLIINDNDSVVVGCQSMFRQKDRFGVIEQIPVVFWLNFRPGFTDLV